MATQVQAGDVRFGGGGTVSFESLRSKFGQNSIRNHQYSIRILGIEVEKHWKTRKNHPEQDSVGIRQKSRN